MLGKHIEAVMMFETKLFIYPTYILQYRKQRLQLSDRHGLIISRFMAASGSRLLRGAIADVVYQEEIRTLGRSSYNFHAVENTLKELNIRLKDWPLYIMHDGSIFYRLVEHTIKRRT